MKSKSLGFILYCVFFAILPYTVSAEISDRSTHVLILGNPQSVSLIKPLSGKEVSGGIAIGDVYKVTLDSVRSIRGELGGPSKMTVELTASHKESIKSNDEIFVLLEVKKGGNITSLYWGVPQKVVCIPEETLLNTELNSKLNSFKRYDGSKCTSY